MNKTLTFSQLHTLFPNDNACLEEIKKLRFPKGIPCVHCQKITKHYRVTNRMSYSCEFCRDHVYPLKGTLFEKSTTPLSIWFFTMLIMTYTRGKVSVRTLQNEIGVTYKTAWRMRQQIMRLMKENHGDLLEEPEQFVTVSFFNAFQLKIVQKQETS